MRRRVSHFGGTAAASFVNVTFSATRQPVATAAQRPVLGLHGTRKNDPSQRQHCPNGPGTRRWSSSTSASVSSSSTLSSTPARDRTAASSAREPASRGEPRAGHGVLHRRIVVGREAEEATPTRRVEERRPGVSRQSARRRDTTPCAVEISAASVVPKTETSTARRAATSALTSSRRAAVRQPLGDEVGLGGSGSGRQELTYTIAVANAGPDPAVARRSPISSRRTSPSCRRPQPPRTVRRHGNDHVPARTTPRTLGDGDDQGHPDDRRRRLEHGVGVVLDRRSGYEQQLGDRDDGRRCGPAALRRPLADEVGLARPVQVGQELTYTITVANSGPNAAANATMNDTLPATVTFGPPRPARARAPAPQRSPALSARSLLEAPRPLSSR